LKLVSSDIASIVHGRLTGPPDLPVTDISTDSRQVSYTEGLVFFAISGKNHDGHSFLRQLYNNGIRIFVVEKKPEKPEELVDACIIDVGNTVKALQLLATFRRKEFRSTVIAVTGSAGKTIVKEWLAEIVGQTAPVIRSPKSYNSQIGVPLSVWKLDNRYSYGVFEAGISLPGEMDKLRGIINPDVGIITNIGDAHRENFTSDAEKAREKLRLFVNAKTIIFCRDHRIIHDLILHDDNLSSKNLIDWSFENRSAAVFASREFSGPDSTILHLLFRGQPFDFKIPFIDRASVENAVTIAAACFALGISPDAIKSGLRTLTSVAMRMEMKSGINNCRLIEDYYNSDPGSLGMAIDFLRTQTGRKPALILSDFVQSGRNEPELYGDVAELVRKTGIEKFIGIGPALSANRKFFREDSKFFVSTDDFIRVFNAADFRNEIILIKGARIFEFEKIGRLLEQQVHQTLLEINLDAISHNLNEFRRHLNPGTKMMVMVKAFAYGAGPAEIAALLEYHRVSYLAVAYADEGVELRNSGVSLPVMVMNPDPSSADTIIRYNLEPEIYSFASLSSFTEAARRHGLVNYPVHLKVDTGMHRLGFLPEEIEMLAEIIKNEDCIRIISVFSHLAGSENPSLDHFSRKQVEAFLEAVDKIRGATGYSFMRHILNSSGIARMPEYQFEMVRPGIGIYGAGNPEGMTLRPAGRFITRISQVKPVRAGEPVGYGCADVSDTDRIIAILPVGYADGLNRKLGNRNGKLFIRERKVPLIGNICMDMCMADVTGTGAEAGDEAEVFGENISIEELAAECGTIPYEILTSIPMRVKRIFYRE
jgi:Alr-MurF fusion protein